MERSFLEVQEIFEFVEGLALPTQSSQLKFMVSGQCIILRGKPLPLQNVN